MMLFSAGDCLCVSSSKYVVPKTRFEVDATTNAVGVPVDIFKTKICKMQS